jgi:hypothetical protein
MLPSENEIEQRRLYRRLGLRSGLLIGLALALGTWLPQTIALSTAHVRHLLPPFLLGTLALVLLGGLAGWLASLRTSAVWGAVVWLLAAVGMIWTIGHLPYEGRSLTIWLTNPRFWGLPIYAYSAAARARLLMAAFFVVLCLTILGLLQNYRLEGIAAETDSRGRLDARGCFLLLLPLPLVFAAGLAADNLVNSPERTALSLVREAISTGRTYEGDLFELSLRRSVNYNAIAGVRDQMSANFTLSTGDINLGRTNNTLVVARFDNGAWINCRVTAEQLMHCYDATPPYLQGFPALLVEGSTPEDCRPCTIKVDDSLRDWILSRRNNWAGTPNITPLAQWGSHVLLRAESPATKREEGAYALECLFHGISPVTLKECKEVKQ